MKRTYNLKNMCEADKIKLGFAKAKKVIKKVTDKGKDTKKEVQDKK